MLLRLASLLLILSQVYLLQVNGYKFRRFSVGSAAYSRDMGKTRYYYDGIDNYLKEIVSTEDPETIMKIIEGWIKRESSPELKQNDAHRLQALVQLHSLIQTDGPGRCTLSSSRILKNNDLSVRGAISKLLPGEIPKRKIERLVNHYASRFLSECDHEKMLKDFDPKYMSYVSRIISDYVNIRAWEESPYMIFHSQPSDYQAFFDQQPATASDFAKNMKGIRPLRDGVFVHRWLTRLTQENFDPLARYLFRVYQDSSHHRTVDGNNVFKLYRKYVGKPCEQFVEKVESSFGSSWALAQSKKMHKRMNTEGPLYKNLAYYHGCGLFLHNEEKLLDSLKTIIHERN